MHHYFTDLLLRLRHFGSLLLRSKYRTVFKSELVELLSRTDILCGSDLICVVHFFLWLKACKSLFDTLLCMNHTYREIVNTEMLDCLSITQKHLCQDWL